MGDEPFEGDWWDQFAADVRTDLVHKIDDSAYVVNLVPAEGGFDVKFAVELGVAIMLDKPIIPVVLPGREVPPGLARVAHALIALDRDLDTEAGRAEMSTKMLAAFAEVESKRGVL